MSTITHNRQSIRLQGYDYSQPGAYFVTIVTHNRVHRFGKIENGQVILNAAGEIAAQQWQRLSLRFPYIIIDEYIVMPNHSHAIVIITEKALESITRHAKAETPALDHAGSSKLEPSSLGAIVRAYKSSVAQLYARTRFATGEPLWQRNYYEHIIRNEAEWQSIRAYIQTNPLNWSSDEYV